MSCVFCRIITGEVLPPSGILKRWPDAIAFEPLEPVTPGHLLVVPVAHTSSFLDDPVVAAAAMARAADFAARGLTYAESNLITSCGDAATQTIHHLHLHLIPRTDGDGLHLPWSHSTNPDLWRVGRSLGRTIYGQVGEEPSKQDVFLGIMENRELAEQVVAEHNGKADG